MEEMSIPPDKYVTMALAYGMSQEELKEDAEMIARDFFGTDAVATILAPRVEVVVLGFPQETLPENKDAITLRVVCRHQELGEMAGAFFIIQSKEDGNGDDHED